MTTDRNDDRYVQELKEATREARAALKDLRAARREAEGLEQWLAEGMTKTFNDIIVRMTEDLIRQGNKVIAIGTETAHETFDRYLRTARYYYEAQKDANNER